MAKKGKGKAPAQKGTSSSTVRMEFTGKGKALIIGSLTVIAGAVVAIVLVLSPSPPTVVEEARDTPSGNYVIDEGNVEEITRTLRENVERGMFETYYTNTWSFPDGHSPSTDAVMGNSSNNNFPFWFTMSLEGTGDIIYTSSLIPLGSQLSEIKLDTPLPQGTYNAVISINMIDDDGEPVENNMDLGVRLIILN